MSSFPLSVYGLASAQGSVFPLIAGWEYTILNPVGGGSFIFEVPPGITTLSAVMIGGSAGGGSQTGVTNAGRGGKGGLSGAGTST